MDFEEPKANIASYSNVILTMKQGDYSTVILDTSPEKARANFKKRNTYQSTPDIFSTIKEWIQDHFLIYPYSVSGVDFKRISMEQANPTHTNTL